MRTFSRALLCALLLLSAPAIADDISNGHYSTTDGSNNSASPNGWPAGMFPNQVEPSARANMGATARWWERGNPKLSTTGSAGAYVITPSNTSYPTAYTQGEIYCGKANFTSVGSDTLNYNSLGAKGMFVSNGTSIAAIGASQILSGEQFCAAYDGSLASGAGGFQLLSAFYPNLSGYVVNTRTLTAGTGLTGGGDLSANRSFAVSYGTTSGTAAQGNDSRITGALQSSNNLSDLGSASTARTNLGLGSAATTSSAAYDAAGAASTAQSNAIAASAQRTSNLSDLSSSSTARSNLGLGGAAVKNTTNGAGNLATVGGASASNLASYLDNTGQLGDSGVATSDVLTKSGNLASISNVATARNNLGLGSLSTKNETVSNSGPSGSASDGDIWLQW